MTARANGHRFDLNAKRAQARDAASDEASARPWEFVFGNPPQVFAIKAQRAWPARSKGHLDRGELEEALNLILDKPDEFWAADPTLGDLEDLFTAYGEAIGVGDLGESAASAPRVSTRM